MGGTPKLESARACARSESADAASWARGTAGAVGIRHTEGFAHGSIGSTWRPIHAEHPAGPPRGEAHETRDLACHRSGARGIAEGARSRDAAADPESAQVRTRRGTGAQPVQRAVRGPHRHARAVAQRAARTAPGAEPLGVQQTGDAVL